MNQYFELHSDNKYYPRPGVDMGKAWESLSPFGRTQLILHGNILNPNQGLSSNEASFAPTERRMNDQHEIEVNNLNEDYDY